MRDQCGVERGPCALCPAQGNECCEFTVPDAYDAEEGGQREDSDEERFLRGHVNVEKYRREPLTRRLRARLSSLQLQNSAVASGDAATAAAPSRKSAATADADGERGGGKCASCGCQAREHEVVAVTDREARCLEVARRLFEPVGLLTCIQQSVRDTQALNLDRRGLTYGEVGIVSVFRILDRVQELQRRKAEDCGLRYHSGVYYDVGCGVGKTVVLASMHSIGFSRCVGVELLPGLSTLGRDLFKRFAMEVGDVAAFVGLPSIPEVELRETDLFEISELPGATCALLNVGCWQEPALTRLRKHLALALPDGCILACIGKNLDHPESAEFVHLEEVMLSMSWGMAPVYIVERRQSEQQKTRSTSRDGARVVNLFCLNSMD
eukprot:TRINITY_DN30219_c0_g1_i1.p1 TRINITY_DN30219_c0_g1~~TRINITY_DN30219_c0_g1_i1.p1  ORF type:complete len:380 (-),score=65.27 TRINITY_DN30219_c0_g1_i1:77-1216(-)